MGLRVHQCVSKSVCLCICVDGTDVEKHCLGFGKFVFVLSWPYKSVTTCGQVDSCVSFGPSAQMVLI